MLHRMRTPLPFSFLAAFATLLVGLPMSCLTPAVAQIPQAIPGDELPPDVRLQPLKDLNGYFPFEPPADRNAWAQRSAQVRQELMVALGLWPLPQRTPLNPVIHGRIEFDDYTVERVYFESLPGFYVTGNLYRPTGELEAGSAPAVLCPHGHWANGRFHDAGEAAAKQQVESGAEVDLEAARSPLQARCVQLARMGCVVFHYDMIGYADSQQITEAIAHRFAKQRPEMNRHEGWGLFSPQAESRLQSVMSLQAWNSIRALDFLESLPEVDHQRLAVTGASGGGTQTFILGAIDPRPAVVFPAVMVSTAMQGGCTCENCSLLRVDTGNVEIAALFAPKPQAMSAADDWTKEMSTKGFPQLKSVYEMLGAGDDVALISRTEFGHNYNYVCRRFMYEWFKKHLHLQGSTEERPFTRLTREQMTVWDDDHPQPPGGDAFERDLLKHLNDDAQQQLAEVVPHQASGQDQFEAMYRQGIEAIFRRKLPDFESLEYALHQKIDRGDTILFTGVLHNRDQDEALPLCFIYPKDWNGTTMIWLDDEGKAAIFQDDGTPTATVQQLLDDGNCVAGVDLLYQGEFLKPGESHDKTRRVENPREAAAYTFGYNDALLVRRVHDVLTTIAYVKGHERGNQEVVLVALDETAPIAAAALAQVSHAVDRAAIDTHGFRFANITEIHDPSFVPGGAKYGDLPGMLALAHDTQLWLSGEGEEIPDLVRRVFTANDRGSHITYVANGEDDDNDRSLSQVIEWLTK